MKQQTRSLQAAARRHQTGPTPKRYRYPAELRRRILAHLERRRAEGATLSAVAAEVGVTTQTLRRWLERDRQPAKLRRVVVTEPEPRPRSAVAERAILVTPTGYRVEGLSVEAVVRILRSLS